MSSTNTLFSVPTSEQFHTLKPVVLKLFLVIVGIFKPHLNPLSPPPHPHTLPVAPVKILTNDISDLLNAK